MGWTFGQDCLIEYPVTGMPITERNPQGNGKVDYVLFGDKLNSTSKCENIQNTKLSQQGNF
jgi:type I restriction enzyme R subunit